VRRSAQRPTRFESSAVDSTTLLKFCPFHKLAATRLWLFPVSRLPFRPSLPSSSFKRSPLFYLLLYRAGSLPTRSSTRLEKWPLPRSTRETYIASVPNWVFLSRPCLSNPKASLSISANGSFGFMIWRSNGQVFFQVS
jgi:hypothetical protein